MNKSFVIWLLITVTTSVIFIFLLLQLPPDISKRTSTAPRIFDIAVSSYLAFLLGLIVSFLFICHTAYKSNFDLSIKDTTMLIINGGSAWGIYETIFMLVYKFHNILSIPHIIFCFIWLYSFGYFCFKETKHKDKNILFLLILIIPAAVGLFSLTNINKYLFLKGFGFYMLDFFFLIIVLIFTCFSILSYIKRNQELSEILFISSISFLLIFFIMSWNSETGLHDPGSFGIAVIFKIFLLYCCFKYTTKNK